MAPIFEYMCPCCGTITEKYEKSHKERAQTRKCHHCSELATLVISKFNTSGTIFTPLTGVDDTDDLTVGKLVANRGVPAEHKRKIRDKINNYNAKRKQYEKRKGAWKFSSDARGNPFNNSE